VTTLMNKTEIPFRVSLLVDRALDKQFVREFYRLVREVLGETLLTTVQVERPDYGRDNVRLLHKTCSSGAHVYDIPLLRNLTEPEFKELKKAFQSLAKAGMTLDSSTVAIKNVRQVTTGGAQIEPETYDTLCDTVAKYQHANWCRERTDSGWKYGTTHNAQDKTSPMIRPWEDLPEAYRKVDKTLPQFVFDQLESLGYVIVPETHLNEIFKKHGSRKSR